MTNKKNQKNASQVSRTSRIRSFVSRVFEHVRSWFRPGARAGGRP